jgi:hypothetical protein
MIPFSFTKIDKKKKIFMLTEYNKKATFGTSANFSVAAGSI